MTRILVVEDDRAILTGLEQNLRFEGYEVLTAADGEAGLTRARRDKPDMLILDIMLPKRNGYEICRLLRHEGNQTPILMLTAKGQEMDKVMGFELGADDYVTKPFGILELLARVKALLRRSHPKTAMPQTLQLGDVTIDFDRFAAMRADQPLEMSTRELELLRFLVQNQGRAVSRQAILDAVWGTDYYGTSRTVDNFVNRLRQKVEQDPSNPRFIHTIRSVGYRFVLGDEQMTSL